MITLNLITTQDRKKLVQHRLTALAKDIIISFLSLSFLLSIILVSCYFILNKNFIEISQVTVSNLKTSDIVSQEVMQINENLKKIEEIQTDYIDWLEVLLALNQLIPREDIQITNLEINHNQKIITLQGKAASREEFLNLKKNLEESKLFKDINSPLTNLLSSKNLNFRLNMNYEPSTLFEKAEKINSLENNFQFLNYYRYESQNKYSDNHPKI